MMLCFLFATLIVALDQFFKHWVMRSIEIGTAGPDIIPGVLGLTHWENDGAMLNVLSGQQWLLAIIALLTAVVLVIILLRYNEGFWGTLGLAAVLGGTVGNLLDRIFNDGKVVDMFRTLFINFPIFNIADIFITLGFITFLIHFIALTVKAEKSETSSAGAAPAYEEDSYPVDTSVFDRPSEVAPIQYRQPAGGNSPAPAEAPLHAAPAAATVAAPPSEDYSTLIGDYDATTDTTPDISYTLEALEAELGSLDVEYDVDELLREYGIEDDDISV